MDILTPTSVYRYYDRNDLLLYVGITRRGIARNIEHSSKEWWPFVVRQEVEHYPHRDGAAQHEKHLIRKFRPPFNKQHNPFFDEMRAIYLAMAGASIEVVPGDARKLLVALHHKLPLSVVGSTPTTLSLACDPVHHPLASVAKWDRTVPLLAPKKVAHLVGIESTGAQTVFLFKSDQRIPQLGHLSMHLKARENKPLVVGIHEVREMEAVA